MKFEKNKIYQGSCVEALKAFPDKFVQCVITSPPYWGLRDYLTAEWVGGNPDCDHVANVAKTKQMGNPEFNENRPSREETKTAGYYADICPKCGAEKVDKQLGLEPTPEEYVENIVKVCREIWRVLRDDGVLYLNLGDTYAGSGCGTNDYRTPGSKSINKSDIMYSKKPPQQQVTRKSRFQKWQSDAEGTIQVSHYTPKASYRGVKAKSLVGIPWRVAFALQDDGWILRQDVIWAKGASGETADKGWHGNPMPESVSDRFTKSHEYIFMLVKRGKYFFDNEAVKEKANYDGRKDTRTKVSVKYKKGGPASGSNAQGLGKGGIERWNWGEDGVPKRNRRSVFACSTKPYRGAHFAVFPETLITPLILASTSARGACATCGKPFERVIADIGAFQERWSNECKDGSPYEAHGIYQKIRATVGWQPSCSCYKLEKTPKTPRSPYANDKDYDKKLEKYIKDMAEWRENWEAMKPLYDSCETNPCVVLDPFFGAGTVGCVAAKLGLDYVGVELNPDYIKQAETRIANAQKVFKFA